VDRKKPPYQLVPEKELKCVWMTAGVLTYKLCRYNMQCETCLLDRELRNLPLSSSPGPTPSQAGRNGCSPEDAGSALSQGEFLGEGDSRSDIKGSLLYHPGHTWVKVEKADEVRVGLDCFLRKIVGPVHVVVLPLPGRRCHRGENLCSLIQENGILHIVCPVSGTVLSVNQKLKDQPDLVTQDPLGEGFLLTLKPKNLQQDQACLLFGEAALSWYQKEWERLKNMVVSELHHGQESVGMTMQDGGIKLKDIKAFVDPERYVQLLSTFLRSGEKLLLQPRYKRRDPSVFGLE